MAKAKSIVHLRAFCEDGQCLVNETLSIREFYEKSHVLLDQADYRKSLKIVRLSGVVYDTRGGVSQEFEVRFDAAGMCVHEAAHYADGTTAGAWDQLKPGEPTPEDCPR